ncbi:MAG TPA: hypothetical protein DCL77_04535 [Prolixibacteraceae bacterium]|jgi:hypothetical protein|nr:hypothetical protein [Prolixibacteraceae bacterium]
MRTKYLLLFLLAIFFCGISMQAQNTISMNPSKDNTLYENLAGSISNGAGDHFYVGETNQGLKRRALLKFDIASNVPTGTSILKVTLTLSMDKASAGSNTIELHVLTTDWGEGASVALEIAGVGGGSGTVAQTNDATWLYSYYNSSLWTTAGGDFNPLVSASTSVSEIGNYTWTSAQLATDVQNWLNNPSSNFGWCLIGNEATLRTTKRFASREFTTTDNRPLLTIVYAPPVSAQETNTDQRCTIFPNPTSGKMQLTVHGVPNAEVKIYNIVGIAVYSHQLQGDIIDIDMSNEPEGIYFYQLMSDKRTIETGKIILRKSVNP